jgi:glycine/D-amino acid oxidase-like deaminating enzyme
MKEISFWLDQEYNPRPSLEGSIETDVLVIGGGITGVSAAYHCAKLGLKTVLIEKETIASGSAGKNGGMIVEGLACDFMEAAERFGEEKSAEMWKKTVEAAALTKSLVKEHSIQCDLTEEGSLYIGLSDDESAWLGQEVEARKRNGIHAEILPEGKKISNSFTHILFNPKDGGLHPVNFVRGLAKAAEEYGARIFENTPAVSWNREGAKTPKGDIRAKRVVLALESGTPGINDTAKTHDSMGIMTEPVLAAVMSALFPRGEMLWTSGHDYLCVRKYKNRLFLNVHSGDAADTLMNIFFTYFPSLEGKVKISHAWHGLMTYPDGLVPMIAETDGVLRVYGHGGNGLTNAVISGRDVATILAGSKGI